MLILYAAVGIVERHVGWLCPDAGVRTIIVVTGLFLLAVDAVDGHRGGEPLGHVVRALVLGIELVGKVIDEAAVVVFIVDGQVVGKLVRPAAQREVILLHHPLLIHGIGIFLGIVVLLERSQLRLQLSLGNLPLGTLIVGILYRGDSLGSQSDGLRGRFDGVGYLSIVVEEIVVPILALCIHSLLRSHIEVVSIVHVLLIIYRQVGGEVDVYLACLLGVLGGDHNNAVGSLGTIDGVGSGILQHVHALDVVWVQVIDATFHRHTVHNQ